MTLTPVQRLGLEWFAKQGGPVALFGVDGPTGVTRKRLLAAGLIEACGRESIGGPLGFTLFRISEAGRAALKESDR